MSMIITPIDCNEFVAPTGATPDNTVPNGKRSTRHVGNINSTPSVRRRMMKASCLALTCSSVPLVGHAFTLSRTRAGRAFIPNSLTRRSATSVADHPNPILDFDFGRDSPELTPGVAPVTDHGVINATEVGDVDVSEVAPMLDLATSMVEVPDFSNVLEAEDETKDQPSAATGIMHDLKTMTLPLLLVWLANPILSLIDTAAVGQSAGLMQLASLGPAVAVCDTGAYVFNFLSVVTTGLVAKALARRDSKSSDESILDGCGAAMVCGVLFSAALLSGLGPLLLQQFMTKGNAAELLPGALTYARIRALAIPAALVATQLQSAALARRNVKLPLMAVAAAGIANGLGDWLLVIKMGMGVAGAAWATIAAQLVACAILIQAEIRRRVSIGRVDGRSLRKRMTCGAQFFARCMSPAAALIGRVAITMGLMFSAGQCGTIALAAHQIVNSIFCLFCPVGEAISQTVMNVLPSAIAKDEAKDEASRSAATATSTSATDESKDTSTPPGSGSGSGSGSGLSGLGPNSLKLVAPLSLMAVCLGAADALGAYTIPAMIPGLFTTSSAVMATMATVAPIMALCCVFHALACALEGVLFSMDDAKFLGIMYPMNSVLALSAFSMLRARGAPLSVVWIGYLSTIVLRFVEMSARLCWRCRTTPVWQRVDETLSTARAAVGTEEGLRTLDSLLDVAASASNPVLAEVPETQAAPQVPGPQRRKAPSIYTRRVRARFASA